MATFSPTLSLLGIGILLSVSWLYWYLLPKPIPGIPYNKNAARSLLGDLPAYAKDMRETKEMMAWLVNQCRIHDSPIAQVFVRPFSKPWVVISDYRETQDITSRRAREFDRSEFNKNGLRAISPEFQFCLSLGDPRWKSSRKLMGETMSTVFLTNVIAPIIHSTTLEIVDLWRQKRRLAQGRPFSAFDDIYKGALDIIFHTAFGVKIGATQAQTSFLSELSEIPLDEDSAAAATIPTTADPEMFTSILTLTDSVEWALKFPLSVYVHKIVLNTFPSVVKAGKVRDQLFKTELSSAFKKYSQQNTKTADVTSAIELMVQREVQAAVKEGRQASPDTQQLRDELFGFILGGHETTSTATVWALKLLARQQQVQDKLRAVLREHHQEAYLNGEQPTVKDITSDQPYLDAVIEECLRIAGVAPMVLRDAVVDTEIFGFHIPKGTTVWMSTGGPDFTSPAIPVEEHKRSPTSQASKDKNGAWDPSDISEFRPERWIKEVDGQTVFDARAGATMPFGGGVRACFGRKLAYLELRMLFTLIVWNFRLEPVPDRYDGWAAIDKITHAPQQTYVNLTELN